MIHLSIYCLVTIITFSITLHIFKGLILCMDEDISEQNNLSNQNSDILKQMVGEAHSWSKTNTEPRWFDPDSLSIDWKEKNMAAFGKTFTIE